MKRYPVEMGWVVEPIDEDGIAAIVSEIDGEEVVLASDYDAACRERDEEIARLRKAIHEHRNNVWGEGGGIYHDEDMKLYAALADTEEGS